MTSADAIIKVRELVGDQRVAMLTTIAPNGELHSRPITICELDDTGTMWFLVSNEADWVLGMAPGSTVNLSIANDDDATWISIAGTASVHHDQAKIDRLWHPTASAFFAGGKDDPSIRLLAVETSTAEYWDAPSSRLQRMAMMAKGMVGGSTDMGDSGTIDMN